MPLPVRTPGLSTARRHAQESIQHALAALRDADLWHATDNPAEALTRHAAALRRLDAAQQSLDAVRRVLADIEARRPR